MAAANKGSNREKLKQGAMIKAQQRRKEKTGLKEYFKGVKLELSKVVWPTKNEMVKFTGVVVGVCAFFALAFWAIDSAALLALKSIIGNY